KLLLREDRATRKRESNSTAEAEPAGYSVQQGFTNKNDQTVLHATDLPGTDFSQSINVLRCGNCTTEYGANGSDIWQRSCPNCQGGAPGLPFAMRRSRRAGPSDRQ